MLRLFISVVIVLTLPFEGHSQIELGDKIPVGLQVDSAEHILTSSADIAQSYSFRMEGILFVVTLNEVGTIDYIQTTDVNFQTPEGVKIDMTLAEVKQLIGRSSDYEKRGWAKYVKLGSGWCAGFQYNSQLTQSSRVIFLFERDKDKNR